MLVVIFWPGFKTGYGTQPLETSTIKNANYFIS